MSYQPRRTWKLKTAPTSEPITTAEAKANLNVDFSDDDTYIDTLIQAAREAAELYTRRAFITQTWTLYLDDFPQNCDNDAIIIPINPLVSVSSIKYIDSDGTQQTMASGDYRVDINSEPARITPTYNTSWPTARQDTNVLEVEFIAGYGAASAVPEAIKSALKQEVAGLYENRERISDITLFENLTATRLLSSYRVLESF